jgi:acyl-CoA dehydrogenase
LPAAQGGSGLDVETAALVMQTIAESGAGMSGVSTVHSYVFIPKAIALPGTDAQRERILPPLVSGAERACLGITRAGCRHRLTRLR